MHTILIYLQEVFFCWLGHCIWYLFGKHFNGFHQLIFHFFSSSWLLSSWSSYLRKYAPFPCIPSNLKMFLEDINDSSEDLWVFMAYLIVAYIKSHGALVAVYCLFFTKRSYRFILNPQLASFLWNSSYHISSDSMNPYMAHSTCIYRKISVLVYHVLDVFWVGILHYVYELASQIH